jgi:hypothetical protein
MIEVVDMKCRVVRYDPSVSGMASIKRCTETGRVWLGALVSDNGKCIASVERPMPSLEDARREFDTTLLKATTQAYSHALHKHKLREEQNNGS